MLVKLTPEQIAANWAFIRQSVIDFSPLELRPSEDRLDRVLESLLIDDMQCWAYAEFADGKSTIYAIVMTTILENRFVGIKNLLMYSVVGFGNSFSTRQWQKGLLALVQFARKNKCKQIIAYTSNENLISLGEKLGGDVTNRVVVFGLDQEAQNGRK